MIKHITFGGIAPYLTMVLGLVIILLSLLVPDGDRNGIAWFCIFGGVTLGLAPSVAAYYKLKR